MLHFADLGVLDHSEKCVLPLWSWNKYEWPKNKWYFNSITGSKYKRQSLVKNLNRAQPNELVQSWCLLLVVCGLRNRSVWIMHGCFMHFWLGSWQGSVHLLDLPWASKSRLMLNWFDWAQFENHLNSGPIANMSEQNTELHLILHVRTNRDS